MRFEQGGAAGPGVNPGPGGGGGSNPTVITVPGEPGDCYQAKYAAKEVSELQPSQSGRTRAPLSAMETQMARSFLSLRRGESVRGSA